MKGRLWGMDRQRGRTHVVGILEALRASSARWSMQPRLRPHGPTACQANGKTQGLSYDPRRLASFSLLCISLEFSFVTSSGEWQRLAHFHSRLVLIEHKIHTKDKEELFRLSAPSKPRRARGFISVSWRRHLVIRFVWQELFTGRRNIPEPANKLAFKCLHFVGQKIIVAS